MHFNNSEEKIEKSVTKQELTISDKEGYKILRAMLLALSILTLCYYGLYNEQMEYKILENGKLLHGLMSRKKIITSITLGYSIWYSIVYAIAAGMLVYSLILKQPEYSLPLMGLFLAEISSDSCDAIVAIWIFFEYLQLQTAIFYSAGIFLFIMGEIWTWLGVLRLYEARSFKIS